MSGVKVLETNHTGITVQDLGYTLTFFTNVLGYKLIGERANSCSAGGTLIMAPPCSSGK